MKLASILPLFLSALGSATASCDVDLFKTVGVIAPSDDAIDIVKQETSSVSFNVTNKWASYDNDMDYVFVQYNEPTTGHLKCVPYADVVASWTSSELKAGCMVNRRISVVTVYVADAAFLSGNVGSLPACCGDDSTVLDDALNSNSNTVSYTYILECVPVACTPAAECKAAPEVTTPIPVKEILTNSDKSKMCGIKECVEVPNGNNPASDTCACTDKSVGMDDGDGFVTGGGWIYLDPANFYADPDVIGVTIANQTKANFGFNSKSRNGVPDGSTNFVIDGNAFHFHSGTGMINYDFLEVPDSIRARWWGTGHLSTAYGTAAEGDVYSFLVAVQDWGEPGADDTWRIRIWEKSTDKLVFDTNPKVTADMSENYALGDEDNLRFLGTELGELDANGGGNIQIHRSKLGRVVMLADDVLCNCDPEERVSPADAGGGAFVTGGGWVYLADAIRNTTGAPDEGLNDVKANFGFNARFQTGNLVPDGSTEFDYDGGGFNFHSVTGPQVNFDFLEIPSPTEARWMGKGTFSTWADGIEYGFMVAVQDNGEPGAADTWRLRIWNPADGDLTLDSEDNPVVPAKYVFDTNPEFPTGWNETSRFLGTTLGELDSNGGGNVQIHWRM
jgi:hypothetical protein